MKKVKQQFVFNSKHLVWILNVIAVLMLIIAGILIYGI